MKLTRHFVSIIFIFAMSSAAIADEKRILMSNNGQNIFVEFKMKNDDIAISKVISQRSSVLTDAQLRSAKPLNANDLIPTGVKTRFKFTLDDITGGIFENDGITSNHATDTRFAEDRNEVKAFGSHGLPYSSTRVQKDEGAPNAGTANLDHTNFPYRTVGKLWFTSDTGTYWCVATVIARGIILTAAQCVQPFGSGSNIYRNFTFIPGHYGASGARPEQFAPYGTWRALHIARPGTWAVGNDPRCGFFIQNNFALLVIKKNDGKFIGDEVGRINYISSADFPSYSFTFLLNEIPGYVAANTTTIGYVEEIDRGNIMQRVDGPTFWTAFLCETSYNKQLNMYMQGSPFTFGFAGAPFIVNFSTSDPELSGPAIPGEDTEIRIVGVGSAAYNASTNPEKIIIASQFNDNFVYSGNFAPYGNGNIGKLMQQLCNYVPAGNVDSYGNQGYCDD